MNRPKRVILSLLLMLTVELVASAQTKTATGMPTGAGRLLSFTARPTKPVFSLGEEVALRSRLKNLSSKRIFVSRYMSIGDFVTLELIGPDGKEVPWSGKIKSVGYNKDSFLMLNPGQEVSANHIISLHKGEGFLMNKPGRYTVRAAYDLGPPEYFATVAPKESIPEGPFRAPTVQFVVSTSSGKR